MTAPVKTAPPAGPGPSDGPDGRPAGGQISQPLEALELANSVRMWRAGAKWVISRLPADAGRVAVAQLLLERPASAGSMPLLDALVAIHRFGRARALRICVTAGVRENKQIGRLTVRQAAALAELLTDGLASPSTGSAETERSAV
jgi:hypothetical protein